MKIEDLVLNKEYLCNWGDGDIQVLVFKEMNIYEWRKCRAKFTTIDGLTTNFFNNEQIARLISEIKATTPTPVPHIHAKEMIAFANGYEIEYYNLCDKKWYAALSPVWRKVKRYRVKTDYSAEIASLETSVADLNKQIEKLTVKKDKELSIIQELQS